MLRLLAFTEDQERELSTVWRCITYSQTYLSTKTNTLQNKNIELSDPTPEPNVLTSWYANLVKTAALLLLFFGVFDSDAQNYETEKLSDSNLSFSLILNPIEVFSMAMERSLTLLQLI